MPCPQLLDYLTENNVEFELTEHPSAYAAQDVAFKAGVPRRLFAKTVLVKLDGLLAMAVLPAHSNIDFQFLRELSGAWRKWIQGIEVQMAQILPNRKPVKQIFCFPDSHPRGLIKGDCFFRGTQPDFFR